MEKSLLPGEIIQSSEENFDEPEKVRIETNIKSEVEEIEKPGFMEELKSWGRETYTKALDKKTYQDFFSGISEKKEKVISYLTKERESAIVSRGGKIAYDFLAGSTGAKSAIDWSLYGLNKIGVKTSMKGDVYKFFAENDMERALLGITNQTIDFSKKSKYKKSEQGNEEYGAYLESRTALVGATKEFKEKVKDLNVSKGRKKELLRELAMIMKNHKLEGAELERGESEDFDRVMRKYTGNKINALKLGKDALNTALGLSGLFGARAISYLGFSSLERGKKEWDKYSRKAHQEKGEGGKWSSAYGEVSEAKVKEVLKNTFVGSLTETYHELVHGEKQTLSTEEKEAQKTASLDHREKRGEEMRDLKRKLEEEGRGLFGRSWSIAKFKMKNIDPVALKHTLNRFQALGKVGRVLAISFAGMSEVEGQGAFSRQYEHLIKSLEEKGWGETVGENMFRSVERTGRIFNPEYYKRALKGIASGLGGVFGVSESEAGEIPSVNKGGGFLGSIKEQRGDSQIGEYEKFKEFNPGLEKLSKGLKQDDQIFQEVFKNHSRGASPLGPLVGRAPEHADRSLEYADADSCQAKDNLRFLYGAGREEDLHAFASSVKIESGNNSIDTYSEAAYEAAKKAPENVQDNFIHRYLDKDVVIKDDKQRLKLIQETVRKLSVANLKMGDGNDVQNSVYEGNVGGLRNNGEFKIIKGDAFRDAQAVSESQLREHAGRIREHLYNVKKILSKKELPESLKEKGVVQEKVLKTVQKMGVKPEVYDSVKDMPVKEFLDAKAGAFGLDPKISDAILQSRESSDDYITYNDAFYDNLNQENHGPFLTDIKGIQHLQESLRGSVDANSGKTVGDFLEEKARHNLSGSSSYASEKQYDEVVLSGPRTEYSSEIVQTIMNQKPYSSLKLDENFLNKIHHDFVTSRDDDTLTGISSMRTIYHSSLNSKQIGNNLGAYLEATTKHRISPVYIHALGDICHDLKTGTLNEKEKALDRLIKYIKSAKDGELAEYVDWEKKGDISGGRDIGFRQVRSSSN